MNNLEKARQEINAIDEQMARLFEQRMDAARDVAAYKMENNLPILDEKREKEVLERNLSRLKNEEYKAGYGRVLQEMMDVSKNLQRALAGHNKVAYCGVEGAFAHKVSEDLFPDREKVPCASFEEVFAQVASQKVEYGVLPLENSNSGLVGEVLDGLMAWPVYIVEATDAHIQQCLLGLPEASLKDVEWVYSKDQALNQSKEFLSSLEVECVPYPNTALAAQYVASCQDRRKAAIGARENAVLYGLKVLASHIEADPSNTTRFLVISAKPPRKAGDHTALMLSIPSEVGALSRVIEVISRFGLNMDCIQSRPRQGKPFEYFFYIQAAGYIDPQKRDQCLKALEPVCSEIRWMGSYTIRKEG